MGELEKETALKALVVLSKANRTVENRVTGIFKEYGVTPTQFSVMDVLNSKGEMKIADLMASMLGTSGNMTVVIKNMERNGWLYRKTDRSDRRACLVGLTEEGQAMIAKILPRHQTNVEQVFGILSQKEQETIIGILKKFKSLAD